MLSQSKISLANKYRPKTLDQLVGQDHVKAYFKNAISNDLMHHAYLFSGSSGTGKTTVARIVAAAVNNPSGPSVSPDMSKDSLPYRIINGGSNDVREIDAASNRGIDDIRSLRAEIKYAPFECRTRFVIIDEAHGLTGQAIEAALKMIEEPPAHTCFILCTTEVHKLKDTIVNRCIDFTFKSISEDLISANIINVSKSEQFECELTASNLIAEKSHGCVRHSLQMLEKVITCKSDNIITLKDVREYLNIVEDEVFVDFMVNIVNKNASKCISDALNLAHNGTPYESTLGSIAKIIRYTMIAKTCNNVSDIIKINEKTKFTIKQILSKISIESLIEMVSYIKDSRDAMSKGVIPALAFEAFIIKSIILYHKSNATKENKENKQ
jgi:DNA polymerase-3 subunit gamma/tau